MTIRKILDTLGHILQEEEESNIID